jgi:chain length determinant protein EpsF
VMLARYRVALFLFGGVVAATVVATIVATRQYVATATVVADMKADPVAATASPSQMAAGYIATQVDIITSERVARAVVEQLGLSRNSAAKASWLRSTMGHGDYADWLAQSLQSHLSVTPSRESNVINIAVRWSDGATAALYANAFARAYLDTDLRLKVEPAKQYTEWFKDRAKVLRQDLETKQRLLGDFQRENGIVATDERVDLENSLLSQLSNSLLAIQSQRQESLSQQATHQPESLPEVRQSPLIIDLNSQLSAAELKRDNLFVRMGRNHPDYLQAVADVESIRHRIQIETARIFNSIATTVKAQELRETQIRNAFEAQKERVLQFKRQRDQAINLQNDVVTAQRDLDAVNQRLAQSSLESANQQTNVVLLTPATEPLYSSSPRLRVNLTIGVFLGALLGLGGALVVELRDRRVRSVEDLKLLSNLPLLGTLRWAPHLR